MDSTKEEIVISVTIPLLQSNTTKEHPKFEQILQESQTERGNTYIKWFILALSVTFWMSGYEYLLSIATLETTILNKLNMNNTRFATSSSILFFIAILGAFISPYITNKYGLYWTLIISVLFIIIGQLLFTFGIELILYIDKINTTFIFNYSLLCMGRGLLGFGIGIQDVSVSAIATLWFGKSKWLSLSLMILSQFVYLHNNAS